jgi:hypothetical protein
LRSHSCLPCFDLSHLFQFSVLDLSGRGFASQEILEELASRGELSNKVRGGLGEKGVV